MLSEKTTLPLFIMLTLESSDILTKIHVHSYDNIDHRLA